MAVGLSISEFRFKPSILSLALSCRNQNCVEGDPRVITQRKQICGDKPDGGSYGASKQLHYGFTYFQQR